MNEITDYHLKRIADQNAKIGALCFARGYAHSAAEWIAERWDRLSTTDHGREQLRVELDELVAVLSIPTGELMAWERTKMATVLGEADDD